MSKETIENVLETAEDLKHVYVATADEGGLPHISAAGKLEITSEGDLAVSEWFCPATFKQCPGEPKSLSCGLET